MALLTLPNFKEENMGKTIVYGDLQTESEIQEIVTTNEKEKEVVIKPQETSEKKQKEENENTSNKG